MKRIQTICISLLLIFTLLITVFAPPFVSRLTDKMLFGSVTTQQLTDTKSVAKTELSIEDKIALFTGYILAQDNIIMVSQDRSIYEQGEKRGIIRIVTNELKKLISMGLFPPIEVSEVQNITFTVKSYINMDNSGMNTENWEIAFTSGKYEVEITMDADTHLILTYMIWTNEPLKFSPAKDMLDLFVKYLGINGGTQTLEKILDTERYKYTDITNAYQLIQVNEETIFGVQIIPIID
ncbi:hypothetical protein [Anaerotignum sp.]|uniref:hypothetical protein n=1 Tax=Anaerotignum sp. TaxID=2039241 RepID=UPI00289E4B75|nr:hypothetical protein [Anaerotignum sp.]